MKESEIYPGFFPIPVPGNVDTLINREGVVISSRTGRKRKLGLNHKGYPTISIRANGRYYQRTVHRVMGLLFIPIPEKYKDIPISDLQINHIDGNKLNTHYSNFEWLTNEENMKHARENNLFDNEKEVYGKNISTGDVITFKSISEAARFFYVTPSALSKHLNSSAAGMVNLDGFRVMFSNGKWPDRFISSIDKGHLNRNLKVVCYNVNSEEIVLSNTLRQGIRTVGLNVNVVMNNRTRKGPHFPNDGWVFYTLDEFIERYGEL
ncbi:hypothetical protein D0726_004868 [Escherichia coli]|nr:hypothetical protein [Escherichia coli]